jgi:L-ascorbate metabolism protein UlaG (beta-lactamase superfamily)
VPKNGERTRPITSIGAPQGRAMRDPGTKPRVGERPEAPWGSATPRRGSRTLTRFVSWRRGSLDGGSPMRNRRAEAEAPRLPRNVYRTLLLPSGMREGGSGGLSSSTRVTYHGHASLAFESGGETLLTDPVYCSRIARFFTKRSQPCEFDPGELRGVVGVLISHAHHDHLDYGSLKRIGRRYPVIVPWGLATSMRWRGFTDVRVIRPWERVTLGAWQVTAVPSRHFGGRLPFVYTSGHLGYVLTGPSCIYFAGDTGYNESMFREIGRRFAIDLAILPIAGALFPWFHRNHMNAHHALLAFRDLGARRLLPMHFETFPASFEPVGLARQQLVEESARLGTDTQLTVLRDGASLYLGAGSSSGSASPPVRSMERTASRA